MSNKYELSIQRENTTINKKSKEEDKQCFEVVKEIIEKLEKDFNINIVLNKRLYLNKIVTSLKKSFSEVPFAVTKTTTFMSPDGGVTYMVDKFGNQYPILIVEVKNQGTNDIRKSEGKSKQAQGNAVERLGKNIIGFKTYMITESIFPFVCFGDGCDFEPGSTILDRVITMAMFGELNTDNTHNVGPNGIFTRGSYYFREPSWTKEEMFDILYDVAKKSIYYYFSKYGEENFREPQQIKKTINC